MGEHHAVLNRLQKRMTLSLKPFATISNVFWYHQNSLSELSSRLIGSYTSPYLRSGISSTSVRNSVFSRVERNGTSGKMLNFSHEWKKSQIFNKDECKYLFLPFQLKNKACRFHSHVNVMFTTQNITTPRAMQYGRNTHLFKTH